MKKNLNNKALYVVISLIAVLSIGSIAAAYAITSNINVEGDYNNYEAPQNVEEVSLGGVAGPDYYPPTPFTVHEKVNSGGTVTNASTTLTSAKTLTAEQVCESSVITVNSAATTATVSAASLDITLPATTTLWAMCLKENGAKTSFILSNLSPTAASTTQIVAGTGIDLLEPGKSSIFDIEIAGGSSALVEITRIDGMETGTLDAIATVTSFTAAD